MSTTKRTLSAKKELRTKERTEEITRILALILCFVIIFGFSIKLIFL